MDKSIRVVPVFPVVLTAAAVVVAGSRLPPATAGEGARVEARATVLPGPGVSLGTEDKVDLGDGDGAYTPTPTGLRPARQEVT